MKYCTNCGAEMADEAVVCVKCGVSAKTVNENDKPSTGLNILSFFFPLIGLILFLCMKNDTPIKAKKCGKWALIGFIVHIVVTIILSIVLSVAGIYLVANSEYYFALI